MKKTKLIALILAVITALSSSVVIFAEDKADLVKLDNAEILGVNEAIKALRDSAVYDKYYDPDEKVTVIIELEGKTLVDVAGEDVVDYISTAKGEKKAASILKNQEKLKKQLLERYDISFEGSISYTATLNAFTAVISYGDLYKIANFRGVKNAFVSGTYALPKVEVTEPKLVGVEDMVSAGAVNGTTYTGEGIVVAVLDTGLVYDHEAFSVAPENAAYTTRKMQRFVNAYRDELNCAGAAKVISEKVIYAYDYADGDSEVYPGEGAGDHGTHVAGIIAGNNGTDFAGIAPDAQLMIMKVFSDNGGGASMYTLLAAIEDAVLLGADVINMSLGITAGFTSSADETVNAVYERVEEAGVVLCCAAGNEAQQASYINAGDYPYADTPDYGVVSSPSTFGAALSVASAENIYIVRNYMTVAGAYNLVYTENEPTVPVSTIFDREYEYVYCGLGYPEEIKNVEGKIALISRGELSFQEKVDNAAAKGAVAVIVMNTDNEVIGMVIEGAAIPAVSITLDDGLIMKNAEVKTVTFASEPGTMLNNLGGTMSDFSSWGCAPNLEIKPEVTAPGGYIYSATYDNEYILMSGTSMACPAMAGSAATMLQYLYRYYPNMEKTVAREEVINRFMSTADLLTDPDSGTYYSPRRQGAGIINIVDAISTRSYLTVDGGRPKASAGSSENGVFKYTFEVNNTTEDNAFYTLDTTVLTDYPASNGVALISALMALELEEGVDYTIGYSAKNGRIVDRTDRGEGIKVAVPAKDNAKVTVTIKLADGTKEFLDTYFVNGTYIEGFTTVTPKEDTELVLPFIGFYGDWASLTIFDGNAYEGNAYYYESAMMVYTEYDTDGDEAANSYEAYNLGYNLISGEYDADKIAYSPNYVYNHSGTPVLCYLSSDTAYLRNAEDVHYTIRDSAGKIVAEYDDYYGSVPKLYYDVNYGFITSNYDYAGIVGEFDSTTLPEGKYTYTITGTSGGGQKQSVTYDFIVDNTAPVIGDYAVDDDIYVFTATDDQALQGVQLMTFVNYGGNTLLGLTALEIYEYTVLLYNLGYITYDEAMAVLEHAPTYLGSESLEDGTMYTYYDVSDYEKFAKAFNKYLAPNIFGEGVTLITDSVAVAALDYAHNLDGYYTVPVE